MAAFASIYFIWGSTFLAIKLAIETIPPLTMIALRSLAAGSILYAWGRLRGAQAPTRREWLTALQVGALLFVLGHGSLSWAEQRVPSGVASLFIATIPLWMTLFQAGIEKNRPFTRRMLAGLGIGLAGIAVLVGPASLLEGEPVDRLGGGVLVLAAVSWSAGSALARRSPPPKSESAATGSYLLAGGALLALVALGRGEASGLEWAEIELGSVAALGYLIIFGSVISFQAYSWLLRRVSLSSVSTYAFVNPIVAVLLGWALGGEALSGRVLVASALVVGAVILILAASNSKGRETGGGRQAP